MGDELKNKIFSGLRWTTAGRFTSQLISWGMTIIVIRLLKPEDYALMAIASLIIGFFILVNELGVVPALIQTRNINSEVISLAFGFVLMTNIFMFAAVYFLSPLISVFFNDLRLTIIIRVLSIQLLFYAIAAIPSALQQRELNFKYISIAEFLGLVLSSLTALTLAYNGYGVWALVFASIANSIISKLVIWLTSDIKPVPKFGIFKIIKLIKFGAIISTQRIIYFINENFGTILIGKLLNTTHLGIYSVAQSLSWLPLSKVMGILNQVAFPAYSQIQYDKKLAGKYYIKSVQNIAIVYFPMMWGLSSISDNFIPLVLGEKWSDASLIFKIICLSVPFRAMIFVLSPAIDGMGRPDINLKNIITNSIITITAISTAIWWGISVVVISLAVSSLFMMLINFNRSKHLFLLTNTILIKAISPMVVSSIIMYLSVYFVKSITAGLFADSILLFLEIITGFLSYICAMKILNNDLYTRFILDIRFFVLNRKFNN